MFIRSARTQPAATLSDEELLAACRQGNRSEAVAELFNRYLHLVYGVCAKYAPDPEDRGDMAMAVFEKLLLQPPAAHIQSISAWLYILTRNACIDWLRRRRYASTTEENWRNQAKSELAIVENEGLLRLHIDEHCLEARLPEAIAQLDESQQACIRLFYFEQKSYKEISDITGLQVSEVKSRLQNGRRRLRGMLGGYATEQ